MVPMKELLSMNINFSVDTDNFSFKSYGMIMASNFEGYCFVCVCVFFFFFLSQNYIEKSVDIEKLSSLILMEYPSNS